MQVKTEKTGWRDAGLSERHRLYGWDCPMVDIDFIGVEYDRSEPVVLIEYKRETAEIQHSKHPSYQALIKLGTRANLPVFACRYAKDFSWFILTPLNGPARDLNFTTKRMTEKEYVDCLYWMRGRPIPDNLIFGEDGCILK